MAVTFGLTLIGSGAALGDAVSDPRALASALIRLATERHFLLQGIDIGRQRLDHLAAGMGTGVNDIEKFGHGMRYVCVESANRSAGGFHETLIAADSFTLGDEVVGEVTVISSPYVNEDVHCTRIAHLPIGGATRSDKTHWLDAVQHELVIQIGNKAGYEVSRDTQGDSWTTYFGRGTILPTHLNVTHKRKDGHRQYWQSANLTVFGGADDDEVIGWSVGYSEEAEHY